jgi:hypothetical protein
MNISAQTLTQQLEHYNAAATSGGLDSFGKQYFPSTFDTARYLWVGQITPVVHYCMGGIAINERAQVRVTLGSNNGKGPELRIAVSSTVYKVGLLKVKCFLHMPNALRCTHLSIVILLEMLEQVMGHGSTGLLYAFGPTLLAFVASPVIHWIDTFVC